MQVPSENPAKRLQQEVVEIWNRNADHWDESMGDGNNFHKALIEPSQLRLLELRGGELVLDAACGNGQFARTMADLGARVVAVDVAPRMLENAAARSADYAGRVEYQRIDCTDPRQLLTLGERRFDHVVCTMALMDLPEIAPLIDASARLLRAGGSFVFSILHPCFNSGISRHGVERSDLSGALVEEYFVRVSRYSESLTTTGLAMPGQPSAQYYFHRSVSALFAGFFAHRFVLDGIEEPVFGAHANPAKVFEMAFQKIPPALVARMRLLK